MCSRRSPVLKRKVWWGAAGLVTLMACGDPAPQEVEYSLRAPIACDLPSIAAAVAGEQATACGVFEAGEAPDRCAAEAFGSAQPFWVVTETVGIDSVLSRAWVHDGDQLWNLLQDDLSGENARVEGVECIGPHADGEEPLGLSCEAVAPEGNSYLVCGQVCDGCSGPMPLLFEHEAAECGVADDDSLVCTVD